MGCFLNVEFCLKKKKKRYFSRYFPFLEIFSKRQKKENVTVSVGHILIARNYGEYDWKKSLKSYRTVRLQTKDNVSKNPFFQIFRHKYKCYQKMFNDNFLDFFKVM